MKLDKAAVARIKNATPKKQKGASAIEYMVLAAVVVGIVIAGLTLLDGDLLTGWIVEMNVLLNSQ